MSPARILPLLVLLSAVLPARAQNVSSEQARALLMMNRLRQTEGADVARARAGALRAAARGASFQVTARSGSIGGTVSGPSPENGPWVMVWPADSSGADYYAEYAKVTADGSYLIENLPSGEYFVMASADGYVPMFYEQATDLSGATTVEVAETSVTGIDFALEVVVPGTGGISGTISSDSGAPVGGASIYAFDPRRPDLYGYAVSDRDGSYVLSGLKSGRYVVQVYADGYLPEFFDDANTYETAKAVEVVEPDVSRSIDFSLSVGGSISGVIRNDDGAPLAGVYVQAVIPLAYDSTVVGADGQTSGGGVWYSGGALSDENGFYRVEGLYPGDYVLYAQTWTSWSFAFVWYPGVQAMEDAVPVHVALGEETSGIDFDLTVPVTTSSISGHVSDAGGDPVADAFVSAELLTSDGYVWAYDITDKEGNYLIEQLPAGSYRVSVSGQVGWEYIQRWYTDAVSPETATPVEVAEGERASGIDLRLPLDGGSASITGSVFNTDGKPLGGAYIHVTSTGPMPENPTVTQGLWAYGVADSAGAYRVDRLPAGSYFVQASYWADESLGKGWYDGTEDFESATPVVLNENDVRDGVDFRLDVRPMYGSVEGTVATDSGDPIQRAYVELSPVGRDVVRDAPIWFTSLYALSDEKGRFRLDGVFEGTYVATVYATGSLEYYDDVQDIREARPIQVVGGKVASLSFALTARNDGDGAITGSVGTDNAGGELVGPGKITAPLDVAVVIAQPVKASDARSRYVAVTARDGTYRLGGMAVGDYVVSTFAPGYVGEYFDNVYSPDEATPVNVDGGSPTTGIDFRLWAIYYMSPLADGGRSAVTVHGTVVDEDGQAVEGATVYLLDIAEQPVASAQTGPDGQFEMRGLFPGSYRVYAGKVGFTGAFNGGASAFADAPLLTIGSGTVGIDLVMTSGVSTRAEADPEQPSGIELLGNYPNPFNPETSIQFRLGRPAHVRIVVYDLLGEEIAVLIDGREEAGLQTVRWDGRTSSGRSTASGIYLYRLESGSEYRTGAMMLLR